MCGGSGGPFATERTIQICRDGGCRKALSTAVTAAARAGRGARRLGQTRRDAEDQRGRWSVPAPGVMKMAVAVVPGGTSAVCHTPGGLIA